MSEFVHLHVHSEFSLLDGLSRVKEMVPFAAALGMKSLALTDHGTMHGVIDFYKACKEHNVKPILGVEMYLAARGMKDRDPTLDKDRYHILLLAQNETGYLNLLQICSDAQLQGYYYKPRIDRDYLAAHSDGLIVTSGCAAAEIPRWLEQGKEKEALKRLEWYIDLFGRDRFYLELQSHSLPWLDDLNRTLVGYSQRYGLGLVATNDVHYVKASDASPHDVLLCVQTGSIVNQKDRMRMSDQSYYIKSPEEMAHLFGNLPGALSNSLKVAEMCNLELNLKGYKLPMFPVPEGYDAESYLRYLVTTGLSWRYPGQEQDPVIVERMEHELKIIHQMGFDNYFLIVWDLCNFARKQDIWFNVRGSGAGSIVAYLCGITGIDPLANNLIFERFLNPGRVSMPDIDMDFPDDQREQMIAYTIQKYGSDRVAQIISFGTMGARAVLRDVGRAMDIPLSEVDRVAKKIPAIPGKPVKLHEALETVPLFREEYESKDYIKTLVDTAERLEGLARHASTHAAGVIIAPEPLVKFVSPSRPTSDKSPTQSVTQFEMEICEYIGLLKVDFLGLSTLTLMRRACELIEKYHGKRYRLENIPIHDPRSYELLSSGEVMGVFQVEGAGMRRVLTEMKPNRFEHIIATLSLFRPGPMDYIGLYVKRLHGEEPVVYRHPTLEPILAETYGIIVYQEQIIKLAQELGGYTAGEADMMRRAIGKKKAEVLLAHRAKLVTGAKERGVPEDVGNAIFDDIEFFARYGFNKAHAADYAVITCQTAYLKAYYPAEYMAALLCIERGNVEKVGSLIAECRRMGIEVLPPEINASELDFALSKTDDATVWKVAQKTKGFHFPVKEGTAIRFGLGAIKNVGEGAVKLILEERHKNGPFRNLEDFCRRIDLRQVNRKALECMIKVGTFGKWGQRAQLLEMMDRLMGFSAETHRAADVGQGSLFDLMSLGDTLENVALGNLPNVPEAESRELLSWEKDLLGVYVSSHPLQKLSIDLSERVTATCGDYAEQVNANVVIAGMVQSVRQITTKKGDTMAFVMLEDLHGTAEAVVFPKVYELSRELLKPDKVLLVRGKVEVRKGEEGHKPSLIVEHIDDHVIQHRAVEGEISTEMDMPRSALMDDEEPSWPASLGHSGTLTPRPPSGLNTLRSEVSAPPRSPVFAAPSSTYGEGMDDAGMILSDGAPAWEQGAPWEEDEQGEAEPSLELPPAPAGAPVAAPDMTSSPAPALSARMGNSSNGSAASMAVQATASETNNSVASEPVKAPTAANGNGHSQNSSNGGHEAHVLEAPKGYPVLQTPPLPSPGGSRPSVRVTLPRYADIGKTITWLEQVHEILQAHPGDDLFCVMVPIGNRWAQVDFPNDRTRYGDELKRALSGLLGPVDEHNLRYE